MSFSICLVTNILYRYLVILPMSNFISSFIVFPTKYVLFIGRRCWARHVLHHPLHWWDSCGGPQVISEKYKIIVSGSGVNPLLCLRTVSFDVPPQEVLTKDSVTVAVDAVVYYNIRSGLSRASASRITTHPQEPHDRRLQRGWLRQGHPPPLRHNSQVHNQL